MLLLGMRSPFTILVSLAVFAFATAFHAQYCGSRQVYCMHFCFVPTSLAEVPQEPDPDLTTVWPSDSWTLSTLWPLLLWLLFLWPLL